jgi:hypothetical protein
MSTQGRYKYKCQVCDKVVLRDFPDPTLNISTSVAPYRLPVRCGCRNNNPETYYLQERVDDSERKSL